jgi:hypothetical protein
MDIATILGVLLLVGAVVYFFLGSKSPDDRTVLFADSIPGETQRTFAGALPRAYNQPEGITYSYAAWIVVKDFTKGYGTKRRIFSKGDAPGLYLDSTSNSLMVAVKTFSTTETILIPDIPAMKWIHFALVVNQQAVDIYINGMLRQHHTLGQLPQQNDELVTTGPGWDGVLARVYYYARSITHVEVKKLASEPPPDDLVRKTSGPQYFDITWYIGRLNSS